MSNLKLVAGAIEGCGPALTDALSAAMVDLYSRLYGPSRTTATTYINNNIVVCVLENILTRDEDELIAGGARGAVIDGRVAFQTNTEDEFTAAIQRLTHRRVVAFLSANQTAPGSLASCSSSMPPHCGTDRDRRLRLMQFSASDEQLMSELSAGSVEAFEQLYDRFGNRAYRLAYSLCGDTGRAQDAVQEAFASLWRNRTSYNPRQGTVAGWLLTVVRNRAIDLARRNGNHAARRASDDQLAERPALDDVSATVFSETPQIVYEPPYLSFPKSSGK